MTKQKMEEAIEHYRSWHWRRTALLSIAIGAMIGGGAGLWLVHLMR